MHEKCHVRSLTTNTKKPVGRTNSGYTIAINVLYINRVEDNAFLLYDLYRHTLAQEPLPRGS